MIVITNTLGEELELGLRLSPTVCFTNRVASDFRFCQVDATKKLAGEDWMARSQCWCAVSLRTLALCIVSVLMHCSQSLAQSLSAEQFFAGKTIDMVVGYPPGGSNDIYSRNVGRHITKYIPGAARVLPRNMPGAGSLVAANWAFNIAPRDGTVLVLLSPTIPLDEKLGTPNIKFQSDRFAWIGRIATSPNPLMVWHTSKATSLKDALAREITLGGTGAGSTVSVFPNVLNKLLGTRFKLVMGYKASTEAMLALERGETEGHSTSWENLKASHPDWLPSGKIRILTVFALERPQALPDIPTAIEFATTDEQRAILRAVLNSTLIGKSVLTTPGVPEDRVAFLRTAFEKMLRDPEFIADFTSIGLAVEPLTGLELQKVVAEVGGMPAALLDKVKAAYGD